MTLKITEGYGNHTVRNKENAKNIQKSIFEDMYQL